MNPTTKTILGAVLVGTLLGAVITFGLKADEAITAYIVAHQHPTVSTFQIDQFCQAQAAATVNPTTWHYKDCVTELNNAIKPKIPATQS